MWVVVVNCNGGRYEEGGDGKMVMCWIDGMDG